MNYRTNYIRVAGLGSAREGTHHWWLQRVSSIALIPLSIPFVWILGTNLGHGREQVIATFGHPLAAVSTILFLIVGFHHLQQGLQVVIEDYVHTKWKTITLFILNILICWTFAVTGIFAVAKMAFGLTN